MCCLPTNKQRLQFGNQGYWISQRKVHVSGCVQPNLEIPGTCSFKVNAKSQRLHLQSEIVTGSCVSTRTAIRKHPEPPAHRNPCCCSECNLTLCLAIQFLQYYWLPGPKNPWCFDFWVELGCHSVTVYWSLHVIFAKLLQCIQTCNLSNTTETQRGGPKCKIWSQQPSSSQISRLSGACRCTKHGMPDPVPAAPGARLQWLPWRHFLANMANLAKQLCIQACFVLPSCSTG